MSIEKACESLMTNIALSFAWAYARRVGIQEEEIESAKFESSVINYYV